MADAPKTATPAVKLGGFDLGMVIASSVIPLALSALGMVTAPWAPIAAAVLGVTWTVCKTFLVSKHLGTRAEVEANVAKLLAAIEKATGKDIPADLESAIEFGAGAAAESAGLTAPATGTAKP